MMNQSVEACWDMWFFFFQAEDGIRDTSVTGVQTCALPIYFRYETLAYRVKCRMGYEFLLIAHPHFAVGFRCRSQGYPAPMENPMIPMRLGSMAGNFRNCFNAAKAIKPRSAAGPVRRCKSRF